MFSIFSNERKRSLMTRDNGLPGITAALRGGVEDDEVSGVQINSTLAVVVVSMMRKLNITKLVIPAEEQPVGQSGELRIDAGENGEIVIESIAHAETTNSVN